MIDEKDVSPTNMPKQTLPKDSKEDEYRLGNFSLEDLSSFLIISQSQ